MTDRDTLRGVDWSTQIAAAIHINGQTLIDMSTWCDWCGQDMIKPIEANIQGRTLKTHKRCHSKTTEFYKL